MATSLVTWQTGRVLLPVLAAAYRQAERVIGQSEFALNELQELFSVPRHRLIRIANPVEVDRLAQAQEGDSPSPFPAGPGPFLIGVGRLGTEKGFDRAIRALPALLRTRPDAQLWIIGEGSERASLLRLAVELGVERSVFLPGFQEDVARWMSHADLFVLSSRTESLPNVLLEAVACRCPVISLEHPGGTREVLTSLGLEDRWVTSLESWNPTWFTRPQPQVHQRLTDQYHWQRIVAEYEELFREAVSDQPSPVSKPKSLHSRASEPSCQLSVVSEAGPSAVLTEN